MSGWETVIGLEVHTELRTETKLFCSCPNRFGSEPNTNVCPVCLGLPGSLPVLNARAVEYAVRIGLALHCRVQASIFHRKNYFYPDMPKDYQISQYDLPIDTDGWLELPGARRVGIERAHLEEDTGKTTHVGAGGRIHDADHSLVDYNRAGVPLVEIVSRPDLRSAAEARAYVDELRAILVAAGASDGRMEEGSVRVDANVSVRPAGSSTYGTRCEIKNMNSLRSLGRAIEYEAARQVGVLEDGGDVAQETRHWNEAEGRTSSMRSKEEAFDYRYFPEPDLVPVEADPAWVEAIRSAMPPMPADIRRRVGEAARMEPESDAVVTVVRLGLDPWVAAAAAAGADANLAVRRLGNEVASELDSVANLDAGRFVELLR
ncbi:MAG: Asp-tRNA(Asn)/Glu-tRNA(Gln) amidotransferase subunit GatB, partial [Acidimicrobiales bacterium]